MTEVVPDLLNKTHEPAPAPLRLPKSRRAGKDHPKNYLPDEGLVDAIRAALLLRRPLLLTGEPGTGKTQCANYVSWKLGYGPEALHFQAKSTSTARDLFYTYNTIGRFHAAQTKEGSQNSVDYIKYNALGEAIVRANAYKTVKEWLPAEFQHGGEPAQSVVLIDEVDKAPRDFPNDVLSEIENLRFRIPEFNNVQIAAEADFAPAVVITSNSEKNLPAPFLRRCVYYNIPKPDKDRFGRVVEARIGADPDAPLIDDSLEFLMYLRGPDSGLNKKPATAELLDWVLLLHAHGAQNGQRLREIRPIAEASLGALVKDEGATAKDLLDTFLKAA